MQTTFGYIALHCAYALGKHIHDCHCQGKDDAGYEVLTHKMNMARKTCEDLKAMYAAKYVCEHFHNGKERDTYFVDNFCRAALHEEFGKKIKKQIKAELGREETGFVLHPAGLAMRCIWLNNDL